MDATLQDDMLPLIALSSGPSSHGSYTLEISPPSRDTFLDRALSIGAVFILKVPLSSLCIRTYMLLLSCAPQCLSVQVII